MSPHSRWLRGRSVVGSACLVVLFGSCAVGEPAAVAPDSSSAPVALATDTCTIPERFRGEDIEVLPLAKKRIALTFDAGANGDAVRPILRTLRRKDVPATFFLTGRFVRTFPVKSSRIARAHLVGNHTRTHPDLTQLTNREVRREIRSAGRIIRNRTGEGPRRFFRFPFGARDARTIRIANDLCYVPFRWTVDTLGWKGTSGGQSVDSVVNRVLAAARPGGIVLMHVGSHPRDGSTLDADALRRIIRELRSLGYGFVRLSRVMSAEP